MRIAMLALGSRGDVQPFTALGLGLEAAGHSVCIAAAEDYRAIVEPYGLEFSPLVGSIMDFMDRHMVYSMLDEPGNPLRFLTGMMETVRPLIAGLVRDVLRACEGADMLVVSTLGLYAGWDVAEKLGIPIVPTHLHPNVPTAAYPHVFFPRLGPLVPSPLRHAYNRLSFRLSDASYWAFILGPLNDARRDLLGLPPVGPLEIARRASANIRPVLHAYSPALTRTPRDWDAGVYVPGYWFLDEPPGWEPPADLLAFLEDGPPPVYVGFGSLLVGRDPDAFTEMVLRALERAGARGILMSGWGDFGNIELPPSVYRVDSVPHSWLFPHISAVVSHGGAGTVGATLRAGVPPVTVPFFGDQFFWSTRVERMGLGPAAVPRRNITEDSLAAALRQATTDTAMRARAAAAGRHIRAEEGVANAVRVITK